MALLSAVYIALYIVTPSIGEEGVQQLESGLEQIAEDEAEEAKEIKES